MKDYTIWLKSGECITGTVNDDVAIMLNESHKILGRIRFKDNDGFVSVKASRIEAIGINFIKDSNKNVGFRR
jgi:hypothetical protein